MVFRPPVLSVHRGDHKMECTLLRWSVEHYDFCGFSESCKINKWWIDLKHFHKNRFAYFLFPLSPPQQVLSRIRGLNCSKHYLTNYLFTSWCLHSCTSIFSNAQSLGNFISWATNKLGKEVRKWFGSRIYTARPGNTALFCHLISLILWSLKENTWYRLRSYKYL